MYEDIAKTVVEQAYASQADADVEFATDAAAIYAALMIMLETSGAIWRDDGSDDRLPKLLETLAEYTRRRKVTKMQALADVARVSLLARAQIIAKAEESRKAPGAAQSDSTAAVDTEPAA